MSRAVVKESLIRPLATTFVGDRWFPPSFSHYRDNSQKSTPSVGRARGLRTRGAGAGCLRRASARCRVGLPSSLALDVRMRRASSGVRFVITSG